MLSKDSQQALTGASIFALEFYKILCGCFLILFVPQDCGNDKICSISDNYHNDHLIHKIGLTSNLISFVLFFSLYIIEVQRENYCINKLDIDPDKPNNNLDDEIENYPILKKKLRNLNEKYYNLTFINLFTQFINIGFSTFVISKNYIGGVPLTPLISYVLLLLSKLYSVYFVSNSSLNQERMYSAYLSVNRTFNTIDSDYVKTFDNNTKELSDNESDVENNNKIEHKSEISEILNKIAEIND